MCEDLLSRNTSILDYINLLLYEHSSTSKLIGTEVQSRALSQARVALMNLSVEINTTRFAITAPTTVTPLIAPIESAWITFEYDLHKHRVRK